MTIVEQAAYLKGLTEGLGVDPESKEGKLWGALCELVSDMAHEIEDLQATSLDYADVLDEISDELEYLEDLTCDLDDDDDDHFFENERACCGGCIGCCLDEDDDDYEEFDDDDDEYCDYDGVLYDVTCPTCGEQLTFDEDTLSLGHMKCPECGEDLEFDLDDSPEDEEK